MFKLIAVTACPTGIAHTYMAAEMLEITASEFSVQIIIETNGAMGTEHKLKKTDIDSCDAIIIAADIKIEMKRFIGKPLIEVSVTEAIRNPKKLIQDAMDGLYKIYQD